MPGFVFLLAMSGSFLLPVHNSPAAPAADEIRVQKKRVVSDAPRAWFFFGGGAFMDFSLVCYLKSPFNTCLKGWKYCFLKGWKIKQISVKCGIITTVKGQNINGDRDRKSDSCVSTE